MTRPAKRSTGLGVAVAALALVALPALTCSHGAPAGGSVATAEEEEEGPVLVGATTREEIERAEPSWVSRTVEAEIDPAAAAELAAVPPGAEVTVFLGTWCSDSAREVPRFWRALDEVGGMVPFEISYVAVDRAKEEPAERVGEAGLRYVPTFVVRREGREIGRVVESSPGGIESDLLALLRGEISGIVSGRDDL